MLTEGQMEVLEKMFPHGFFLTWVAKLDKKTPQGKDRKIGLFVHNPEGNGDIDVAFKQVSSNYLGEEEG